MIKKQTLNKKVIILWAWWHAEVIKNILEYDSETEFLWYLDDNKVEAEVVWTISDASKYIDDTYFICWIWNNEVRKNIYNWIKRKWWKFINAIHTTSTIEKWVILWDGVMVWAHSYLNIWVKVWNNTIINNNNVIEHHNTIWNDCHLAPWVITWWTVCVKDLVFLWMWSVVVNNISIWEKVYAWAWTVINKDVKSNSKIVWVPFKYLNK